MIMFNETGMPEYPLLKVSGPKYKLGKTKTNFLIFMMRISNQLR